MLEDTLVKLGRGDSVYRGKSFCFGGFFFFTTAKLERKVMLEQGRREAGWSFAFLSLAEGGVLVTEVLQAFTCSVKRM